MAPQVNTKEEPQAKLIAWGLVGRIEADCKAV